MLLCITPGCWRELDTCVPCGLNIWRRKKGEGVNLATRRRRKQLVDIRVERKVGMKCSFVGCCSFVGMSRSFVGMSRSSVGMSRSSVGMSRSSVGMKCSHTAPYSSPQLLTAPFGLRSACGRHAVGMKCSFVGMIRPYFVRGIRSSVGMSRSFVDMKCSFVDMKIPWCTEKFLEWCEAHGCG
jgi:hypothetical protein